MADQAAVAGAHFRQGSLGIVFEVSWVLLTGNILKPLAPSALAAVVIAALWFAESTLYLALTAVAQACSSVVTTVAYYYLRAEKEGTTLGAVARVFD